MPVIIRKNTKKLAPVGMHLARCVWCIDTGTHDTKFGKKKKLRLAFELPEHKAVFKEENGEEPFLLSIPFNHSLDKKSKFVGYLRPWIGNDFTKKDCPLGSLILGKACYANVIHETKDTGETYAEIIGLMPVPKGTDVPDQILPSIDYSVSDGVDNDVFEKLPVWLQEEIKASDEIAGVRPTETEVIERNVRTATANALAEQETEEDGAFDLDRYSDADLRKPEVVAEIREIIEDLPCSNGEKANQYRYLNQLVRRAKANAPSDDDNEVPL
jgi:hypothetical protein